MIKRTKLKRRLLSAALIASGAAAWPAAPLGAQAVEPNGKALYLKNCKRCHGVLGDPTKDAIREDDKIPRLSDALFYTKNTDKELFKAIKEGKGRNMKSFAEKLSDEEIAAVLKYIHTLVKEK